MADKITFLTPNQTNYLCVEQSTGLLVGDRTSVGPWEEFIVEPQGDNMFALRSTSTDRYLSFMSPEECRARNVPEYSVMGTAEYVDIWERVLVQKFRYGVTIFCPYWDKYLSAQDYGGKEVLGNGPQAADWEVFVPSDYSVFGLGGGSIAGEVRKLEGQLRTYGRSFGDQSGPRIVHGCSDFGGIVKHHENRDKSLAELDSVAAHHQFIRVAWRLNGWYWTPSGLTLDPIRDAWWEDAVRSYLTDCNERGLRVNLSCMDMYNWNSGQANTNIAILAQIAASVSKDVVIYHEWNEMRGTCPGGEEDWQVNQLREMSRIWKEHYPWSMIGLSDPGGQDKAGMQNLSQEPANLAIVHNVRWEAHDAIRRAFNIMYENYPGKPIVEGEPTGPNGSPPHNQYTRLVWCPTEDHNDLLAISTMNILVGVIWTYFNDPALVSREPLASTWGFSEIPRLWRELEIPENIGQGKLYPGHWTDAPLYVMGSNALRSDGVEIEGEFFGYISGGNGWRVKCGRSGDLALFNASGIIHEGRINKGDTIPASGPVATGVRIRY